MPAAHPAPDSELVVQRRRSRKLVGGIIFATGFVLIAIGFGLYWFGRTPTSAGRVYTATVTRVEPITGANDHVFVRLPADASPEQAEFLLPTDGFEYTRHPGDTLDVAFDPAAHPPAVRLYTSGFSLVAIVLSMAGFFDLIFGFVVLNFGLPGDWRQSAAEMETPDFNPYNRR